MSNKDQNPDSDQGNSPKTPKLGDKPSRATFFFWFIMLIIIPAFIYMGMNAGDKKDVQKLKQSEYETYLREGKVKEIVETVDNSTRVVEVEGIYLNDDREDIAFKLEVRNSEELIKLRQSAKDPDGNPVKYEPKTADNRWGEFLMNIVPILIIFIIIYFVFARKMNSAGRGAMQFGKSRAKLQGNGPKVTFKDVAGIDESKEEVQEVVDYLKDPSKVQNLGGRVPKGVLLVGPPGTGKTLLARAIAGEADAPFYSISGSDFVEMFVGVGASRVRDMFEQAKKNPPCLIFIDEIDAVGRARFAGIGGGNDEREQTLNALLVEMDGFEVNSGVIVIAATNRPDVLDKALLRPGRFDRQISIDLPDRKGREEILNVHSKKIKLNTEVNLSVVARGTPGFSGADLSNLLNESALIAARTDKKAVDMTDLEEAKEKVCWGRERKSRKMGKKERYCTAVHEAGHALVGLYQEHSTPLHKVTIIPRGNSYLGATMYLPEDDRYSRTMPEMKADLAISMGGRIAEDIIIGEITSGASGDIMQATETAKKMVCQWGMSDALGPLNYASSRESIYAGRDPNKAENHGTDTSNLIDSEVKRIVTDAVNEARAILEQHRDKLVLFSDTLLEKETMDVAEICDLLGIDKKQEDKERFSDLVEKDSTEKNEEITSEEDVVTDES